MATDASSQPPSSVEMERQRLDQARLEAQRVEQTRQQQRLESRPVEEAHKAAPQVEAQEVRQAEEIEAARQAARRVEAARQQRAQETRRAEQRPAQSAERLTPDLEQSTNPEGPQVPDTFAAADEIVKSMEKANISFNTPKTMNRDDTVVIHLLLSLKEEADELKKKD